MLDANGTAVHVDVLLTSGNASTVSAVFPVTLPPAGFATYFLVYAGDVSAAETKVSRPGMPPDHQHCAAVDGAAKHLESVLHADI